MYHLMTTTRKTNWGSLNMIEMTKIPEYLQPKLDEMKAKLKTYGVQQTVPSLKYEVVSVIVNGIKVQ